MKAFVALSEVADGNMYTPSDQTNKQVIDNRHDWLKRHGSSLEDATRLYVTYDTDSFCRYRIVDASNKGEGMRDGNTEQVDALVTTERNHTLFLPVADCVAATLFDKDNGVLMLSHLGRHSLEQQGGTNSVAFLEKEFGSNPKTIEVWLGPAPNKEVYPIFKLNNQGLKEAALEQLATAGILPSNIHDTVADTATDGRYFSFSDYLKGNQPEGRFAMMAVMKN